MKAEYILESVKTLLNKHLGSGDYKKANEASFFCPKCNHYKKKLQFNLITQTYHCWVCSFKGRGLYKLFKRTNATNTLLQASKEFNVKENAPNTNKQEQDLVAKHLPEEFRPLYINFNTPDYKNALNYVINRRSLTPYDILRYNIGYCEEGDYKGMIIIPSYDKNNHLNYFVGRSYYKDSYRKHKNPTWSKDVIGFENQISFKQPLTLVEGAFDAITTKRNTIPLFGKIIMPILKQRILTQQVPKLYIGLDKDAIKSALRELEYFMNQGIKVYFIKLNDKDPNEVGFEEMIKNRKICEQFTFSDLIKHKLSI